MRGLKGRYANDKVNLFPLIMASPSPVINVPDVTVGATRRLIEQSVEKPVLAEAALHHEAKPLLILFVMTPTTISAISHPVTVIRTMVKYVHQINYSGPQRSWLFATTVSHAHFILQVLHRNECFLCKSQIWGRQLPSVALCAKPQAAWNLPSKASTSFLQQYLVSPSTIFGPFPDNIWSPPVGKCRVRANFLCFTVAYWGQVYNTDWHRIWHKSSLPIDKWSSFAGCDSWINGGRIFIFLCIWLKNQLGKRTGGSQGLTGNNVMTVGRNAPPKTLLAFRNVAEDFHNFCLYLDQNASSLAFGTMVLC